MLSTLEIKCRKKRLASETCQKYQQNTPLEVYINSRAVLNFVVAHISGLTLHGIVHKHNRAVASSHTI
jgi:hypothetical protein